MANLRAFAPASIVFAMTNAYAADFYLCKGGSQIQFTTTTTATVAFTVELTAYDGGTATEELVPAGSSPFTQELSRGGWFLLRAKADAGTPNGHLRVS